MKRFSSFFSRLPFTVHWRWAFFIWLIVFFAHPLWGESADSAGRRQLENEYYLTNQGILYGKSGQFDQALKSFEAALRIQKKRLGRTYNNIGYVYELKGNIQEAQKYYELALQQDPEILEANANLGRILFGQRDWQRAVFYGEKALSLHPGYEEVKSWLPKAYDRLNEQRKRRIYGPLSQKKN